MRHLLDQTNVALSALALSKWAQVQNGGLCTVNEPFLLIRFRPICSSAALKRAAARAFDSAAVALARMEKLDINSSGHMQYDPYVQEGDVLSFPERLLDLYLVDLFEDSDVKVTVKKGTVRVKLGTGGRLLDKKGRETELTKDHLRQAQIDAFNANVWYPELPDGATFFSVFLELSPADLDELEAAARQAVGLAITNVHKILHQLVQENLAKFGGSFFVKLNSVSPKDLDPSSLGKHLRFSSALDALTALIKSGRTLGTIRARRFPISIVLRKWCDLPDDTEYRCFVHRGKLRAVSQYDCYKYCPELQSPQVQQQILARIVQFYGALFMSIPYEDCVMDVVIWDEKKSESYKQLGLFIIEFNPFGAELSTGAALFNWDRDYNILYAAPTPVLRVVTEESLESKLDRMAVSSAQP